MKTMLITISLLIVAFIIWNYMAKNRDPYIYTVNTIPGGGEAMTFPPFGIFIKETAKNSAHIIDHEICHWRQYQKKGLIEFWWDYFDQSKKFNYEDTPMEKACYLVAE